MRKVLCSCFESAEVSVVSVSLRYQKAAEESSAEKKKVVHILYILILVQRQFVELMQYYCTVSFDKHSLKSMISASCLHCFF